MYFFILHPMQKSSFQGCEYYIDLVSHKQTNTSLFEGLPFFALHVNGFFFLRHLHKWCSYSIGECIIFGTWKDAVTWIVTRLTITISPRDPECFLQSQTGMWRFYKIDVADFFPTPLGIDKGTLLLQCRHTSTLGLEILSIIMIIIWTNKDGVMMPSSALLVDVCCRREC